MTLRPHSAVSLCFGNDVLDISHFIYQHYIFTTRRFQEAKGYIPVFQQVRCSIKGEDSVWLSRKEILVTQFESFMKCALLVSFGKYRLF
jgi:hypothetical protein